MMTRKQYRECIEMLGISQRGAAKFFDIGERTSRRLAGKHAEIPRPIEMVLRIMAAKKLSPEDVFKLCDIELPERGFASWLWDDVMHEKIVNKPPSKRRKRKKALG